MLRKLLERSAGPISTDVLKEILELATIDIKINRIRFARRTSIREAVEISEICYLVLRRTKKVA
jgi:hypothetical protein